MSKAAFIYNYVKYFFKANNRHDIHSPFLFNLVNAVLYDKSPYPTFGKIEKLRKRLKNDSTPVTLTDFGAGSIVGAINKTKKSTVKVIAGSAAKPGKYAQLLFRLAAYLQPRQMIELGTSLGISACYQAAAVPDAKLITCEGSDVLAGIARQNFNELNLNNIEVVTGNFDETLPLVLSKMNSVDWVFFDGNHRKEPTISYFKLALEKINNNTVFIFDDINWSSQMQEAWQEIKQNDKVVVTIDIFMMGIVLFNTDLSRQHFVIRY